MAYRHFNEGNGTIGFYDSSKEFHVLKPGESCVIDVAKPGYGVVVEEVSDVVSPKKEGKKDKNFEESDTK